MGVSECLMDYVDKGCVRMGRWGCEGGVGGVDIGGGGGGVRGELGVWILVGGGGGGGGRRSLQCGKHARPSSC